MQELFSRHPSGVFLRREAIQAGYDDQALRRGVHHGHLHKLRTGAYVSAPVWAQADERERHRLRSSAVALQHPFQVALSHTSAAIRHGLRLFRPDLCTIHVTRLDDQTGRRLGDLQHHQSSWRPEDLFFDGEAMVLSPVRSAYETAVLGTPQQALVVLDSLHHLGLTTASEADACFEITFAKWPDSQKVRVAHALASPGSESVGESLTKYLFFTEGLPTPVQQFKVYDRDHLVGSVDFALPEHGVFVEFDGKVKYSELQREGESAADVVFREKKREDRIRELTGFTMIRLTWPDLFRPAHTAARIRGAMSRRQRAA